MSILNMKLRPAAGSLTQRRGTSPSTCFSVSEQIKHQRRKGLGLKCIYWCHDVLPVYRAQPGSGCSPGRPGLSSGCCTPPPASPCGGWAGLSTPPLPPGGLTAGAPARTESSPAGRSAARTPRHSPAPGGAHHRERESCSCNVSVHVQQYATLFFLFFKLFSCIIYFRFCLVRDSLMVDIYLWFLIQMSCCILHNCLWICVYVRYLSQA